MRSAHCFWVVALSALLVAAGAAAASRQDKYSVVANKEIVGSAVVTRAGANIDIDYRVDNNGRGPKHKEHIALLPNGIPTVWMIDGASLMGGTVHEEMRWENGIQKWESQADSGEVRSSRAALYVANDASDWALGLYVRALLGTAAGSLPALPAGTLKLEKLKSLTVGAGKQKIAVDAYLLAGINLKPDIVLLDRGGRLFAVLAQEMTIRAGYEMYYGELMSLADELGLKRLEDLRRQTAHAYDVPVRFVMSGCSIRLRAPPAASSMSYSTAAASPRSLPPGKADTATKRSSTAKAAPSSPACTISTPTATSGTARSTSPAASPPCATWATTTRPFPC
jgi:hypothetical protein